MYISKQIKIVGREKKKKERKREREREREKERERGSTVNRYFYIS